MAFKFEPVAIRESDTSGKLACAGLLWTEWRMWLVILTFQLGVLSVMGAVACQFVASDAVRLNAVPAICMLGVFSAIAHFKLTRRFRSILFHRDGSIETPQGLLFQRAAHYMPAHHAHIRSIERVRHGHYWYVDIYTVAGAIVTVARLNHMSDAHMVVTQLNNALEELRRDMLLADERPRESALIN